ncbi:MAG: aromatic ring-hydroxylating dioxygenase subunit alpha [Acidiferrobacterales bacterium]|nr:aromatic ring-hydroxylating dioxygenase subunit alpha [Acidiferrobacterales bacterium]
MITETLSADWYVNSDVYQKERERIFAPAWWLIAPLRQLTNPGDYVSDRICGWPVFAIRSADGQLRAFINICRHRGASVLPEGAGTAESIRCPYHGWLYDDRGQLLKAPKFGADPKTDCNTLSLREIGLHLWNDLVFVKIKPELGVDFTEWIGEVDSLCQSFASPSDLDYHGEFTVRGDLNWKTYCDNTVEGYHLNLVHPRLGRALAQGGVELFSVNEGRSVAFDVTHGSDGGGEFLRGRKGMWIYHFPGLQLVLGQNIFKAERVESTSPTTVVSRNWAWYSGLSAAEKDDSFQWAKQIVEEDFSICSQVTRNMQSGAYLPGPLSGAMEVHVARFQQIVREALTD